MCYGSQLVFKTEPAQVGPQYRIMNAGDFGMESGVLVRPNEGPRAKDAKISCAACVTEEMRVRITGVPHDMQVRYGIADTIAARFLPAAENDHTDWIDTGEHRLPLAAFVHDDVRLMLLAAENVISPAALAA